MKLFEQNLLNKIIKDEQLLKEHKLSFNNFIININDIIETSNYMFPNTLKVSNLSDFKYIWSPSELVNDFEAQISSCLGEDANNDSVDIENTLNFAEKGLELIHKILNSDSIFFYYNDDFDFVLDCEPISFDDMKHPLKVLKNALKKQLKHDLNNANIKDLLSALQRPTLSEQYTDIEAYVANTYEYHHLRNHSTRYLLKHFKSLHQYCDCLDNIQLKALHKKLMNNKVNHRYMYTEIIHGGHINSINSKIYPYSKRGLIQLVKLLVEKAR